MLENINIKILLPILFFIMGIIAMPKTVAHSEVVPIPELPKIDVKQIQCMAKNIFYEAGSESIKGQAAVARVVMNRVAHGFASTPCAVIYQTAVVNESKVCQFSWVCEGKREPNKNNTQYKIAQQVAYDVMVHDKYKEVVPKSVLFFHNLSVTPLWPYAEALTIGNHVFYSRLKKKSVKPKKEELNSD